MFISFLCTFLSESQMRAKGRLTRNRKIVLQVLRSSRQHPTAADVFRMVRRRRRGISFATIYNALNWLKRSGLIVSVRFLDEANRYDFVLDRHDHLVCTHCGALTDTQLTLPSEVVSRAARRAGFRIERHSTELFGLCGQCSLDQP
jgi:Fur family transcriptional regulator, peroxide stress response regulator